jgi:hypothetical protein
MANQVTIKYQAEPTGASTTTLSVLMSQPPVSLDILQAAGLRVVSDGTPVANPVVRTIAIAFGPSVPASSASCQVFEGTIISIAGPSTPGLDYVLPPAVSFTGEGDNVLSQPTAQSFLNLQAVAVESGGAGYSPQSFGVILGSMAPPTQVQRTWPGTLSTSIAPTGDIPPSCVQAIGISIQGRGYSTSARVVFDGPLDPNNPNARPAQAVITQLGPHGEILAVQITDPGEGYVRVPKVTVQEDIPFGIEIARKPDAITGAVVGPMNIIAPNPVTAKLSAFMGLGTAATIKLTFIGSEVSGATVTGSGDMYTGVAIIAVVDPTGSGTGAVLTARMGVSSTIQLISPGAGLDPGTTPVLTEYFKTLFPDMSDQRAPFWQLMETAIAVNALSPITSAPPVLT